MTRKKTDLTIRHQFAGRIRLLEAVRTPAFYKLKESTGILIPLGTTRDGGMEILDFSKIYHLLVAGSVLSGKTEFLNCVITSIALSCPPGEVQLDLIDTTRVEFLSFNGLPHLIQPVVISTEQALENLYRLADESAARCRRLEAAGVLNIRAYNRQNNPPLPYRVVVMYELSDLMYGFHAATETLLCKITQTRPDTGIHLVVATQRPENMVISNNVKEAFPARVCFSVNNAVGSVTILGMAGAEKLNEAGEMLYEFPGRSNPVFLQGYTISYKEIDRFIASFT
jgi:DNA segregation ATPase FtsK/SpoIIIE, S-DNA-T family